jgi:A/G-specific adenine glycosylase
MTIRQENGLSEVEIARCRNDLLAWYDTQAREMPWRVGPMQRDKGVAPIPYHVWLSEVMLQQTTVATVGPYFQRFLARFPTVSALAEAPREEVLSLWAGLGYYARARNLHACAQAIVSLHGGAFPSTEAALRTLPGIGAYTGAAVAAIAFDQPSNVVDGNVERVMARLFCEETPLPGAKAPLTEHAQKFVKPERPGDWAQALMDLGATVCTPRSPRCAACPVAAYCAAFHRGGAEKYPVRPQKKVRPDLFGIAFVAVSKGSVLLRRRSEKGLLGGMTEVPNSPWLSSIPDESAAMGFAPQQADWRSMGNIQHIFSHFSLELQVFRADDCSECAGDGFYLALSDLADAALPSLMRKVLKRAGIG